MITEQMIKCNYTGSEHGWRSRKASNAAVMRG
nr:MAG TPA: hypothetical protein [Caudoviricetes sp.]